MQLSDEVFEKVQTMKKVYVAMSGGVDSSVAAALLKDQGYSVVGVFIKFWSPEGGHCIWKEERQDALRVAAKLGIPLLTWDFTQEYEENVVAYMLEAYRGGITPNPDIMCNKEIKFGMFFNKAISEGVDYVATGHYSRILTTNGQQINRQQTTEITPPDLPFKRGGDVSRLSSVSQSSIYGLYQAVDKNKDQSYFLYTLEQRHLEKTLFPIGGYTKPEVRELAKKYELPTAEKKDSQGVCFIGPLKMKEFLKDYIHIKSGKVIHKDGRVLGEHDGAHYYTIGQRHGIDLGIAGGPYYVIGKDMKQNVVYVGSQEDLLANEMIIANIHWIGDAPKLPAEIGVKIRYRSQTVLASIKYQVSSIRENEKNQNSLIPNTNYLIQFHQPVRAVTPGQAAVLYDGERTLGGGIIIK